MVLYKLSNHRDWRKQADDPRHHRSVLDLHPSEWEEETEHWEDTAPRKDPHVVRDLVGLVCLFAAFALAMIIMGPMIDALFWELL